MKQNEFLKKLEKIFEKNKLTKNSSLSNLNFDSLKILEILSFADNEFTDIKIDANKLTKCKSINDLIKIFKIKD